MRTIEEARALMLSLVPAMGSETVALEESVGRVLAEPVVAPHDVPGFANSAMDGFAVRAADTSEGAVLEVVGEVAAGATPSAPIGAGQAMKIMTGAPMPDGADAVIRVEDTFEEEGKVRLAVAVQPGEAVRPPGGDVAAGATVFPSGVRIGPAHVGVLATSGVTSPAVSVRPRVAVLSTGDELMPAASAELEPGRIRDSNRPMIVAMVAEAGGRPLDMGRVPDDASSLRSALGEAVASADIVVTSGGVSMGERDVIKEVLSAEADVEFFPVAMKPGKPQGFGTVGGVPFFGLPGNPVSVMISFEQFVRPSLLRMQGASALLRPRVTGIAGEDLESDPEKEEFIRVRLVGPGEEWRVVKTGGQGSHVLSGAANADAFAVLPRGVSRAREGERVLLELFRAAETRTVADV